MLSEIPRTNSMTNCRIGWVTTTTPMRFPSTRSTRCSRLAGGAEAVLHVVSNRRGKQIPLDLALRHLERLAVQHLCRQSRDRHRLAPEGLSPVLGLEGPTR